MILARKDRKEARARGHPAALHLGINFRRSGGNQVLDQKVIDQPEAARLLALQEGHFLDFKSAAIAPAKLSETIAAFGNTAGGELFVGIGESADKRSHFWSGFETMESANGLFQVIERMNALANHYHATFLRSDGLAGLVLHLVIPKTRSILRSTSGDVFVRHNAQNLRVSNADAMRRLELDKGIMSFEDETVNVPLSVITNSSTAIEFVLEVVPTAEPDEWMEKQNLIVRGKPVVAGVLLFSDEPQSALPKRSAIKIYRYGTKEKDGRRDQLMFDPITIEGGIYNQISAAVADTKRLVEDIRVLTAKGLEPVSYPHETLHEIITNAVLHRDYSLPADVKVRIYDNRIEVESPGRLPGHVTPANILKEQSARNPKIVRLINKFPNPPNKDVGEGLNTAFEAMKKLRLKEPEIVEDEHSVVIHIRHTPLATAADTVMGYLDNNVEITNRIARELTGIQSENSMKNVFYSLSKAALIEPVPGKKVGGGAAWRKVNRSPRDG